MKRITILTFVVFCFVPTAWSQSTSDNGVRQLVTELQREVAQLQVTVRDQATTINTLQNKLVQQNQELAQLATTVGSHGEKLRFVSVKDTEMFITGANLNIRDGSGFTSGTPGAPTVATPNGLGNLVIGYNECDGCPPAVQFRSGSHNLVLGENNGYTSFGGIVVGFANSVAGPYATITGGGHSISSGLFSSVSGGEGNKATVEGAAVSGGLGGIASGRWASVTGGAENTASEESSSVCGGSANTASGLFSTVTGGTGNKVTAQSSSISGGGFVVVNTQFSWAAGSLVSP
jgi:hypothetical protein